MIELGTEARDKITGFSGIVIARTGYITGCDQYTLSGKLNEEGVIGDNYKFDEDRLEIIGKGINKKNVRGKTSGGPQPTAKIIK